MYRVTKRFARGPESPVGTYKTLSEAKNVVQDKLAEDAGMRINATYVIYEGMDLLEELDQSKRIDTPSESQSSGSSGRGAGQSFSPSPFNMTPAPKGMPRSGFKDDANKDDKDKR